MAHRRSERFALGRVARYGGHDTQTPSQFVDRFPWIFFRPQSFAPRSRRVAATSFIRGGVDALLLAPLLELALDVARVAVHTRVEVERLVARTDR